ncbi:hypothetical protein FRC03_003609 [Tulasnella sp. 419]|nr:hypothetical protein FRC03_003609 [Tulasnella sp. 419]
MTSFGMKNKADDLASGHPMGRFGSVEDMAGVALFLTSPASKHITGALIPVDGGALVHKSGGALGTIEKAKL